MEDAPDNGAPPNLPPALPPPAIENGDSGAPAAQDWNTLGLPPVPDTDTEISSEQMNHNDAAEDIWELNWPGVPTTNRQRNHSDSGTDNEQPPSKHRRSEPATPQRRSKPDTFKERLRVEVQKHRKNTSSTGPDPISHWNAASSSTFGH